MEEFDKDVLNDFFKNIEKETSNEIDIAEEELKGYIDKLNSLLANVEARLKAAEEEGDEALYNLELNRKNLVLQKISELEAINTSSKFKVQGSKL